MAIVVTTVMAIVITTATAIYLNVILHLCNAKWLLRAFGGRRSKKLRGRLLALRSRQGFRKQEYYGVMVFFLFSGAGTEVGRLSRANYYFIS